MNFRVKIESRDANKPSDTFSYVAAGTIDTLARVLYQGAERIASKGRRLAPVLTGTLRSTIHAERPKIRGGFKVSCDVVAGGPAAPYALRQHEMHRTHSKFIEKPGIEEAPVIAQEATAAIDELWKGPR